jgi:membrane-associated protein
MKETMITFIQHYGYAAIFISMMLGIIGLPLPVEFLLLFAGSIVAATKLHMIWLIVFAWLGAIAGMSVNYGLGRTIGIASISKITKYVHLHEEKLNRLAIRFQKSGPIFIVIGYFVAGLRHASPFIAGASGMPYKKFVVYAWGGGLLWISVFTLFGQKFGHHWRSIMKWLHHPIAILAILVVCLLAFLLKKRIFSSISHVHDVK